MLQSCNVVKLQSCKVAMHPVGTVPTVKMHPVGTVPTDKMHPVGTVPTDKMHPVGVCIEEDIC